MSYMAKEILLYNGIFSHTSERFINSMEESKGDDVVLRMDTPGGDPQSMFGMIAKWNEHPKGKELKIDGRAYSGGAFFACYTKNVTALDVSEFLFHRGSWGEFVESRDAFSGSIQEQQVIQTNKELRAAFEAKVDVGKFEKITKVSVDDLFAMKDSEGNFSRIEVLLTAKDALDIGLINKIKNITPEISASVESRRDQADLLIAAYSNPTKTPTTETKESEPTATTQPEAPTAQETTESETDENMDLKELKTKHPTAYAEAKAEGVTEGASNERDRVEAYMVFADVDLPGVTAGIESGKAMSGKEGAQFARKSMSAEHVANLENDTPEAIATTASDAKIETAKEKQISALSEGVLEELGIKKPTK